MMQKHTDGNGHSDNTEQNVREIPDFSLHARNGIGIIKVDA